MNHKTKLAFTLFVLILCAIPFFAVKVEPIQASNEGHLSVWESEWVSVIPKSAANFKHNFDKLPSFIEAFAALHNKSDAITAIPLSNYPGGCIYIQGINNTVISVWNGCEVTVQVRVSAIEYRP